MRSRRSIILLALFAVTLPSLRALEKPHQAARIVDVQKKSRDRVLYYLVNTPVTQDEPYYEVSVRLSGTVYVAEYTPFHAAESLPADWSPGAAVQVRLAGHRLFLVRPDGTELGFAIVSHAPAEPTR
jgi:hypothetical protein